MASRTLAGEAPCRACRDRVAQSLTDDPITTGGLFDGLVCGTRGVADIFKSYRAVFRAAAALLESAGARGIRTQ
jgi:hypothetical protein